MRFGQILAGADPLIAIRYQIVVMFMLVRWLDSHEYDHRHAQYPFPLLRPKRSAAGDGGFDGCCAIAVTFFFDQAWLLELSLKR
jgi:hypothetical protein